MRRTPLSRAPGFTLVEVLVATAIIAVTLAAGSRTAGSLINNAQRITDVTLAQWCADNRLTALKLARQFPDVGESSQECPQMAQTYMLNMKVQGTLNPNFRRVDIRVSDAQQVPQISLSTVLPRF